MALFDKNKPFVGARIYDYFLEVWERIGGLPADLNTIELNENKKTDIESNKTSNIYYPTVKAVYNWVSGLFVKGAVSSTDNAIARFDGVTGKLVKNSNIIVSDSGSTVITGGSALKFSLTGNTASTNDNDIPEVSIKNLNNSGIATSKYVIGNGYIEGSPEMWLSASAFHGENHIRNVSNHPLSFWTNNLKRFTIESNGMAFARYGLRVSGAFFDSTNNAGSSGHILKNVSGLPVWSKGSKVSVINNPSAGTASGVVAMTQKILDTGNEYSTVTNRWTPSSAGTYLLHASVAKVASTETKVYFRKNGIIFGVGSSISVTTNHEILNVTPEIVELQAGDYIDVFVSSGQIVTDFPTNSFKAFTIN